MYGTPLEPPAGAVLTEGVADAPASIPVQLTGPARQNRLTVAFRLILAIPQAFVLQFIFLAAGVVLIIGWFGALFTGRLPRFAADFLAGTLRWQTRYYAYIYLLTGVYPPFSLDDYPAYPARVATEPGKLNRLAVLFRLVLIIPAAVLQAVVVYGMSTIVLFVTWLIVLIRGTMPKPLHLAIAAVVRYATRVSGYYWMLTSEYPWGLFGDPAGPAEPAEFARPAESAESADFAGPDEPPESPESAGPAGPSGPSEFAGPAGPAEFAAPAAESAPPVVLPPSGESPVPAAPEPVPAYGAVPPGGVAYETVPPPTPAAAPARGDRWPLVLSAGAKRLVWLFIALGVASIAAGVVIASVAASSTVNTALAISKVQTAHDTLLRATESYATTTASCQRKADPLPCVTGADRDIAQAFGAFSHSVRGTAMPSSATAAASTLASDSERAQRIFQQLASSGSFSQYQQTLQSSGLEQVLNHFDRDYQALGTALNAK
jgi:Domain of unknown function (DUF4389)